MPRSFKRRDDETLESLARQSGWYLAAWRDFSEMTLDELSEKAGIGRGMLSELETGKPRKAGPPPRYNRSTVEAVAQAMRIAPGRLFDGNPFTTDQRIRAVQDAMLRLDDRDKDEVARLVETLMRRNPAA